MTHKPKSNSNFPAVAAVLVATLLVLAPVAAARAEDGGKPEPVAAESTTAGADGKPAATQAADSGSQPPSTSAADPAFVPSEEISEDLSVPFPVDI